MKSFIKHSFFFTLLIGMLLLVGCGGGGNSDSEQAEEPAEQTDVVTEGGTLTIAIPVDIVGFDSAKLVDVPTLMLLKNICENLVSVDFDGNYLPQLAERWENSEDLMTWTFFLRQGVKFSDGTPFNAEAVKFNYDRYMDKNVAVAWSKFSNIEKVEVVDEYTVRFILSKPMAAFIDTCIAEHAPMMNSPEAVKKYGDKYVENPVGTGPFVLKEFSRSQRVVLEPNPDYWNGSVKLDQLIYRIIPDTETALLELESGGVDIVTTIPPEQFERLKSNPDLNIQSDPNHTIRGIFFNFGSPIVQDVRMRQAIGHGINVDEIVKSLCGDVVIRSAGPTPVVSWAHKKDFKEPAYEPEKAKQLLEEMGWKVGSDGIRVKDGERLSLKLLGSNGRYIKDKEIADAVQNDLKVIGIEVVLDIVEGSQLWTKLETKKGFDIAFAGVGPRPSTDPAEQPISVFLLQGASINFFNYANPRLDELMDEANKTADKEQRKEIYYQVQDMLEEEVTGIWMYSDQSLAAVSSKVKGYKHSGSRTAWLYNDVTVEE